MSDGSVVGLFAGIGGFEIGLGRAGFRTDVLCEIMPEARAVLQYASKKIDSIVGAKIVPDVTSNDLARTLPDKIEILTAGFPCQDLSQAGQTAGIAGERSGLVGKLFELVSRRKTESRPRWIIIENVSFMRHLGAGEAMRYVLSNLSKLGYSWAYREIDAMAFGLPQRRKRLFIVACQPGEGDPCSVLFRSENPDAESIPNPVDWRDGVACGFYWTEGNRGTGFAVDSVPTIKGGSGLGIPSPPAVILPEGRIVLPNIRDAERLQGFPRGWTEPASAVDAGRGRVRWKLVGNAVSVPVAEWIGRGIAERSQGQGRALGFPFEEGDRWPRAAWQLDPAGSIFSAEIGDRPVNRSAKSLMEILSAESHILRPDLSHTATAGFLRRLEASNLLKRKPDLREAFLDLLRRHANKQQENRRVPA